LVSKLTRTPAARAASIAAKPVSQALALIASEMPDRCGLSTRRGAS